MNGIALAAARAAGLFLVALVAFAAPGSQVLAAEKPPLAPDVLPAFVTESRISAAVEFALPALAAELEREIPRRLASINERVECVHRRVLFFRVKANCDIFGFVERTGEISLSGRGDRIYASLRIHGALEGQGANRFTARIRGETDAVADVEVDARPSLRRDWTLDLNIRDGFKWSEPPILHILGREISLASRAEPRIRAELARVSARASAAAKRLDLRGKAAAAWRQAFEPVQLVQTPEIWLRMTPSRAAFAGVAADAKTLRGSLELAGSVETFVGQRPPALTPTALPPLGDDVAQPGEFDAIVPIRVGYDTLKNAVLAAASLLPPSTGLSVRDAEVYPSSGKLVVGLRVAKASETDPAAGEWVYLAGGLRADADSIGLSDLGTAIAGQQLAPELDTLAAQLRDNLKVNYDAAYQDILKSAGEKLTRPLKDGFRMEGRLASAKLERIGLSSEGVVIALRAAGHLKILYGK